VLSFRSLMATFAFSSLLAATYTLALWANKAFHSWVSTMKYLVPTVSHNLPSLSLYQSQY
jgi:hypothetical protein